MVGLQSVHHNQRQAGKEWKNRTFLEYSESTLYFQAIEYQSKMIISNLSNEEMFEARAPKSNGNTKDDFWLWSIRVRAAFREEEFYMALSNDCVEPNKNGKALAIILPSSE